jgi:hypothetical protein
VETLLGTLLSRIVLQLPPSLEPIAESDVRRLIKSADRLTGFHAAVEGLAAADSPLGLWLRELSERWVESLRGAAGNPRLVSVVLHRPES